MEPIVLLIAAGIILLLLETFVFPGFGISGLLGLGCMVGACYCGFLHYGTKGLTITIIICSVLITAFIVFLLRSKTWKKAALDTNIESRVDCDPEEKGLEVGAEGITITRLNPMGHARFGEVEVEVRSEDGMVDPKTEVVISRIENEKIFIKIK